MSGCRARRHEAASEVRCHDSIPSMDVNRTARATSFGAWAEEYDDCRPSYPASAVEWLLGDARRVVEIGAGTGKLTDRLVEHHGVALDVIEIDRRMLRVIRERHPTLSVHETGATDLPLADGAADAVLVADAWQWLPKDETASEVARVLRAGGWLGCVWNDMAASTPEWQWEAVRLRADIADQVRGLAPLERLGVTTGHAEQRTFRWRWMLSPRQWRGYVSTLSHVRSLPPRECQQALDVAERLATEWCEAADTIAIALDLDAVCIRWLPRPM
jgi:SAM-dependent methyltransferase